MTQNPGQYSGIWSCLSEIVKEEGTSALFAGAVPRMTSIAFGGAIFFGAYEVAKAAITVEMEKKIAAANVES